MMLNVVAGDLSYVGRWRVTGKKSDFGVTLSITYDRVATGTGCFRLRVHPFVPILLPSGNRMAGLRSVEA